MSSAANRFMQARARFAASTRAAAVLLLVVGAAHAADTPDPVVAQRGAVTLTAKDVQQILAAADPEARAQMQRDPRLLMQRVRDRMLQLVLVDQARTEKLDQRPDVAYRAEVARDGAIAESYVASKVTLPPDYPSQKEVEAAYAANKSKLMLARQYHLAQILVAVPPNSPEATVAEAKKHAADLRRQAVDGHKDFAALARQSSDDKNSAEKGGDLGWMQENILLPDLRHALTGLATNAVTEPVRTPDGWHVLKVLGVKAPAVATLAEAHDTLVRAMRQERTLQLQRQFVMDMMRQEPIRIDQVELWKQTAQ
ncbi:MAG TPA: peptidylprolyl isomerase [Acetobacteraceae bacterium]|nr:peptidylprolyl isomerase [Acetobacteraceae bacterium]